MARTTIFIHAAPEAVFDTLARPATYAQAAAGRDAAEVGGSWPEPGSSVGVDRGLPPARIRDTVAVEQAVRPTRLVLDGGIPGLRASIDVQLEQRFGATLVVLTERPRDGGLARVPRPVLDVALRAHNRRVLSRLRRLAEARSRPG